MFDEMLLWHKKGLEFPFVKEELPMYAKKFGGDVVQMSVTEEADFLMNCNDFELVQGTVELIEMCSKKEIPMYVLSNSGFTGDALTLILERFGIGGYFRKLWSSADFGKIKPTREFFELAVKNALEDNPGEGREDILFVGDTYDSDVKGAHDAGIKCAWINKDGREDPQKLAAYEIAAISGLKDIIG